jgi:dTDP-glucose pyrophosphorylase
MKRTIIIPAAGLASRMKPLSRGVSKAMIPVNGRPLISYIIENCGSFDEMIIVENELGDIAEFVNRVYPHMPIKFVTQENKLGPLHAIHLGWEKSTVEDSAVTIWLGDTICLEKFDWEENFVAVHQVPDPHRWCLIDEHGNLYDKPDVEVPTDKALIGVYHFLERDLFNEAIEAGMAAPTHKGEHQIAALLEEYQGLIGFPFALHDSYEWYDCGELNTYYESKARLLKRTARSFNKIEVDTFYGTVTKSSEDTERSNKIEMEKQWFTGLSQNQSLFCPRILDSPKGVMKMSLEPGTALNEVLVYDNLRVDVWHDIIRKILKIHHDVFFTPSDDIGDEPHHHAFVSYYLKNRDRMKSITKMFGHPEVEEFVNNTSLELCKDPIWSKVMHGDSHLGNIIYDPFSGNIKFVDPRGQFGHHIGTMGDLRYDLGKLLQDFYCGYAMLMADRFEIKGKTVEINWVGNTEELGNFLENELNNHGYDVALLKKLAIVLLVTAIPFHSDNPNRQSAFFYRALNLINENNESIRKTTRESKHRGKTSGHANVSA